MNFFFYFTKKRSNSIPPSNHLSPLTSAVMQGELLKILFYLEMRWLVLLRLLIRTGIFLSPVIFFLTAEIISPLFQVFKVTSQRLPSASSCIFTCYSLVLHYNRLRWGLLLFCEMVKITYQKIAWEKVVKDRLGTYWT